MAEPLSHDALRALSRERIEKGSRSFAAASKLFDEETRDAVHMLYAWCRHCDDTIDDQDLGFARGDTPVPHDKRKVLEELRRDTIAALAGETAVEPVFQALAHVAARYGIPQDQPLAHIRGFEMDVEQTDYDTIEDTLQYCYHVAGVVGVMMARIMGADGEDTLDRACDLGMAFQLTNICRDVMDDAAIGRVYLPSQWLEQAGVSPDEIAMRQHRQKVFTVATRALDLADMYYTSASVGIARLPLRSAAAIAAARNVYRAIGTALREKGPEAWDSRVSTSRNQKVLRVGQGLMQAVTSRVSVAAPYDRKNLWTRP